MPSTRRALLLAHGVLVLSLLAIIADELIAAAPGAAVGSSAETRPLPKSALDEPRLDVDALVAVILGRPLFTPGRRPPSPPPPVAAQAAPPPQLTSRLAGMIVTPADREALFARKGQNPLSVAVGGTVDGWTVEAIDLDHVTLSSVVGTRSLEPTAGERGEGAPARRGQNAAPPLTPTPPAVAAKSAAPAKPDRKVAPAQRPGAAARTALP